MVQYLSHATVITAPTIPGATVEQAKEQLRITHSDEDLLIEGFVAAATGYFEWITGRTVYETTLEAAADYFPCSVIQLPRAYPFISLVSIKYTDSESVETTLNASMYAVDTIRGRVMPAYGESWPTFTPYPANAVKIRYKAGHPNNSPQTYVDAGIRQCIVEMVGSLYENRESVVASDRTSVAAFVENPVTLRLMAQYKNAYAF